MISTHSINDTPINRKLLAAILLLLSLQWYITLTIVGAFLLFLLTLFSLLMGALLEVGSSLSQIWQASDSIERLIMFLVAWAFCWKVTPVICSLLRKGLPL